MDRVNWIAAYVVGAAYCQIDAHEVVATLVEAGLDLSLLPAAREAVAALNLIDGVTRDAADRLMVLAVTSDGAATERVGDQAFGSSPAAEGAWGTASASTVRAG